MAVTSGYRAAVVAATVIGLAGCATVSPEGPFQEVAATVEGRTGQQISWQAGAFRDYSVDAVVEGLLSRPLTTASAVQIALLNNRELQATYAELGIAQADLAQAAKPPNPIVDGAITFPEDGGTNLVFGATMGVIELLYIPLKKRVAESRLEEAKLIVAGQVIELAGRAYLAFIDYQTSLQLIEFFEQVLKSSRATLEAAKTLREAGNITALQFELEKNQIIDAKLALARAEKQSVAAREALNELMGLSGRQTEWRASHRLPDLPVREIDTGNSEARAIERSLDLAAARQKLITLAKKYRLTRATSIIPDLEAGGEWERDDGERQKGPTFEVQLPLFDWGRARKARARMEIVQARDEYTALAVKIRSTARLARADLLTFRKMTEYYKKAVLPQSEKTLNETLREYNAMQLGVFRLIESKRRQIEAGQQYVQALSDYWKARARFSQLMSGKLPSPAERGTVRIASGGRQAADTGGH